MPNTLFGYVYRNVSVPILKERELDAEYPAQGHKVTE